MTKEQIRAEAMALETKDREELAEDLFQSVETGRLTPEQQKELHRRVDAIDRGQMSLTPADEAIKRLRERRGR